MAEAPDQDDRRTVTCENVVVPANESVGIVLNVTAPTMAGTITNRASIDEDGDGTPEASSEPVATNVVPNLVIDKLDDPDPVRGPEDLLLYTIRVQNQGDTPVSGVAVTDNLPLDVLDFVEVESDDFDCQFTAGVVQCNLEPDVDSAGLASPGTLGVGEIVTVQIVVEPEVAGTISNRAALFVNGIRGPIRTSTEETLVLEPAVTDEDEDPDDGDGATDNNNGGNSNNNNDDNNGNGSNDDNGADALGDDDGIVVISGDDNEVDNDVIEETIPGKVLPFTGGASAAILLGGGALVVLGALAVRFVRFRGF